MYLNAQQNIQDSFKELWLTLTWDVFKLVSIINFFHDIIRLTLTWDVFKC